MSRWFSESVSRRQEHLTEAVEKTAEGVDDPGVKDIGQEVDLRSQWIIYKSVAAVLLFLLFYNAPNVTISLD